MTQHERAQRGIEIEQPRRNDDAHVAQAEHRRPQ